MGRCNTDCRLVLGILLSGCNIVQGFQDAGDTLFPEEATHLNAPGLRVVRGGFRDLRVATGLELYLLARSPDDDTSALHAMRYADPRPCPIPGVGRFVTSFNPTRNPVLVTYYAPEDTARRGTLRFADLDCRSYDLALEDALPVGEAQRGFVIWAGTELLVIDPTSGLRERLVQNTEQVIHDLFGGRHAVASQGRLHVFDGDWEDEGSFGTGVVGLARAGRSVIYEDSEGIHRLSPPTSGTKLDDTLIAPGACGLGMRDPTWAVYRMPCTDGRLFAYNDQTAVESPLPIDADPRFVLLMAKAGSSGEDPERDPFWFFTLREVSPETNLGTLVVRTPEGEEHVLGERATLQRLRLLEQSDDAETYGYAFTEVEGPTARYVYWKPDGTTRPLAEDVFRDTSRLVVDYDGQRGNLAVASGDRLLTVIEGVPAQGIEYPDQKGRFTALFHDFDGADGQLSLIPRSLDSLERVPPTSPWPEFEVEHIAGNVRIFRTALLGQVLPGVIYLADFEDERGTGRLEYRNLELGFTALVNHGVSDYLVGGDEVLYSIPFGENAGIWIVPAK